MPVPNSMSDLATLAGSNFPTGTESIGNSLDNYLRAHAAIIRSTNALASATIAAASTTNVSSADAESVIITGAATITSLGTGFNGCRRELRFQGACTLTHSTNLQLPNGDNITTANGDVIVFRCIASGQWVLVNSNRAADSRRLAGVAPSAFALTLLDDADAAAARTTLGAQAALGYTPLRNTTDTLTGDLTVTGFVQSSAVGGFVGSSHCVLATTGAATISLRPNGAGSTTGQLQIDSSGNGSSGGQFTFGGFVGIGNAFVATTGANSIFLRPNGIGSTTNQATYNSSGNLTIAGTGTAVNWSATSDMHLKGDIRPLAVDESLADFIADEFVEFTWTAGAREGFRDQSLLAQHLQRRAARYVHEDEGGWLSIDKASLSMEAVAGLARRLQRVEALLAV